VSEARINIAEDFSRYPSGRVISDGPNSGQKFREKLLIPALKEHEIVVVFLDGVRGYPSSFTEEAFGGLVREGFSKNDLLKRIRIEFTSGAYSGYKSDIIEAIKSAEVH
jgi:hypothetical protein